MKEHTILSLSKWASDSIWRSVSTFTVSEPLDRNKPNGNLESERARSPLLAEWNKGPVHCEIRLDIAILTGWNGQTQRHR